MKYFLFLSCTVLVSINIILLWQLYRKVRQTPDEDTVTDWKPYILGRLIGFAVNSAIMIVLSILHRSCIL